MGKNDDYGYFGSGSSGYAHYMQSFDDTAKGSGGGGSPDRNNNNNDNNSTYGCAVMFIGFLLFRFIAVASQDADGLRLIFLYVAAAAVLAIATWLALKSQN